MTDYKKRCSDCVCLIEYPVGEWFCDLCQKPCKDVSNCPEGEVTNDK